MYLYQFTLGLIEDASCKIFYFDLQLRRKFLRKKKRIYKTKVNILQIFQSKIQKKNYLSLHFYIVIFFKFHSFHLNKDLKKKHKTLRPN